MDAITSYHDLCTEIAILELRLDGLLEEEECLSRNMLISPRVKLTASYSGMPGAGMDATPLNRQWGYITKVRQEMAHIKDILSLKVECKKRMESRMEEYEGIYYVVAFKRDIENKPLYEIAAEINKSYDYIRKISASVERYRPSA